MQASLFEKQDRFEVGLGHIIKGLIRRGGSHKFIEVHIRKYQLDTGKDLSIVLKALRDVESHAKGICLTLSTISSLRPLKKRFINKPSDMDKYFRSKFKDEDLVVDADLDEIYMLAEDLNKSYTNVSSTAFRIFNENGDAELGDELRQMFIDLWKSIGTLLKKIDRIKKDAV